MTKLPSKKNSRISEKEKVAVMEKILRAYHPQGMRPTNLEEKMKEEFLPRLITSFGLSKIVRKYDTKFEKEPIQGRGVIYRWIRNSSDLKQEDPTTKYKKSKYKEESFYRPFAKFLEYSKEDDEESLKECTKAIPLGGKWFGDLWATPDAIGLFERQRGGVVDFPTEVISAEIKIDDSPAAIMTAFGQACAYRLFSHKTYLVVPKSADINRLEKICHILGIGLVYFDATAEKIEPSIFEVKLRAQKHEPNMFYVNQYIGKIAEKLK